MSPRNYLQPLVVVPLFLVVFIAVLYVLGKLFTARVGSIFEPLVRRLPLVRGVYASVKKVTDFALVDSGEVRYLRVVAIEFPRPGIWTVGLVTGEGMTDIAGAAGEPCLTVAVPGSPVPFTGNVVTVRKSEAHDLSISIDEALQFFISCGVVVPRRELPSKDAAKHLPMSLPAPTTTAGATTTLAGPPAVKRRNMSDTPVIRIGTRASPLARWQAAWVAQSLAAAGNRTTLVPITTRGDVQQAGPVEQIGTRGVFTKELQRALLDGQIDVAVHSLKDLPTEPVAGLMLAAVPERESPFDVLVLAASRRRTGFSALAALPAGARIGTGSLRRQSQLLHLRPDLAVLPIRGNVDTRLRKLDAGDFDALVLAQAGLRRLGFEHRATQVLTADEMLPAVGQGALGLEARADDDATRAALAAMDHPPSHAAVLAERSLLDSLDGGCLAPIGALATMDSSVRMRLSAVVLSRDGQTRLQAEAEGLVSVEQDAQREFDRAEAEAIELGGLLADSLIAQGARELIRAARS